jgi:hypothetical protein
MKPTPKPITISDDMAARCNASDQAERMDNLFRAVLAVPHSAVLKE